MTNDEIWLYKKAQEGGGGGGGGGEPKRVSYLKWKITKTRDIPFAGALQVSELYIYQNAERYEWNENVSITTNMDGESGQEISKLIDDDIFSKYCTTQWGSSQTSECDIVIDLGETITISGTSAYSFVTGGDEPTRDPVSWVLYGSADGTTWEELDSRTDADISMTRNYQTNFYPMSEVSGVGDTLLKGTSTPSSSVGDNGQIYLEYIDGSSITEDYTYDQELNWSCKNDYYVHDTSQLLSTHSTAFYKTVAGGAIAVEWHYSSYYGPILISTNQNYVKYTRNENPNYSVVIDGITWYMSSNEYWNGTEDNNATIPLFTTNYNPTSNVLQAIKDILLASGFINGNYDNSVNKAYLKVNSTWQNLISSNIYDVGNTTETDVPIDMNDISAFRESSMYVLSDDDTAIISWSSGGVNIGFTAYYSTPIDVTNLNKLKYELKTRSCYGNGSQAQSPNWYVQIGLMANAPATFINAEYSQAGFAAGNYFTNSNTDYGTKEIDVSNLSGDYYFVINAHGWNASIKNLRSE